MHRRIVPDAGRVTAAPTTHAAGRTTGAIGRTLAAAGAVALAAALSAAAGPTGTADLALDAMVDAERAFARMSAEQGMRAAFLAHIADDGIGFRPGPVPLKEAVRSDPDPPPGSRLLWEPRYGDIAASGDLGYVTGPYTFESASPDGGVLRRHGCFFSVWRRQGKAGWRNVLDIGVRLDAAPDFAPGFTRAPRAGRFAGKSSAAKATRSLQVADEDFNRAARDTSFGIALGTVLDPAARVHRAGRAPLTSRADALRALAGARPLADAATLFAAAAASGDLGYTYGRYLHTGAGAESGHYARAWVRDADGNWRLAADITSPDAGKP